MIDVDECQQNVATISAKHLLERHARQFESWLEKKIEQCHLFVRPKNTGYNCSVF